MEILSGFSNSDDVDALWTDNPRFMDGIQQLLSLYFGTVISVQISDDAINNSNAFWKDESIYVMIAGIFVLVLRLVLLVFGIIKYLLYKQRFEISNPMVIMYGIGF